MDADKHGYKTVFSSVFIRGSRLTTAKNAKQTKVGVEYENGILTEIVFACFSYFAVLKKRRPSESILKVHFKTTDGRGYKTVFSSVFIRGSRLTTTKNSN